MQGVRGRPPPPPQVPTVGLNIARLDAFGCPLVLWDLGGQAGLRGIWDKYYAEVSVCVIFLGGGQDRIGHWQRGPVDVASQSSPGRQLCLPAS